MICLIIEEKQNAAVIPSLHLTLELANKFLLDYISHNWLDSDTDVELPKDPEVAIRCYAEYNLDFNCTIAEVEVPTEDSPTVFQKD